MCARRLAYELQIQSRSLNSHRFRAYPSEQSQQFKRRISRVNQNGRCRLLFVITCILVCHCHFYYPVLLLFFIICRLHIFKGSIRWNFRPRVGLNGEISRMRITNVR